MIKKFFVGVLIAISTFGICTISEAHHGSYHGGNYCEDGYCQR